MQYDVVCFSLLHVDTHIVMLSFMKITLNSLSGLLSILIYLDSLICTFRGYSIIFSIFIIFPFQICISGGMDLYFYDCRRLHFPKDASLVIIVVYVAEFIASWTTLYSFFGCG